MGKPLSFGLSLTGKQSESVSSVSSMNVLQSGFDDERYLPDYKLNQKKYLLLIAALVTTNYSFRAVNKVGGVSSLDYYVNTLVEHIRNEIRKVIVGQDHVIEQVL